MRRATKGLHQRATGSEAQQAGRAVPSPLLFHSEAAMALMNFAETLEDEGKFGDAAKDAWEKASAEWERFKYRDLSTYYSYFVRLVDLELFRQQLADYQKKLDDLMPGEMEKAKQEAGDKFTPEEKAALAKKRADRDPDEQKLADAAGERLNITWEQVALRATPEQWADARGLSDEIAELKQKISTIDTYRDIVNYSYWDTRAASEQTQDCLDARDLLAQAAELYEAGHLYEAKQKYEQSFEKWRKVLDAYPILRDNSIMADDLVDEINKYKKVIGKIPNTKFPGKFVLQDMIDLNDGKRTSSSAFGHMTNANDVSDLFDAAKKQGEKNADQNEVGNVEAGREKIGSEEDRCTKSDVKGGKTDAAKNK